jgi:NAD(P)-dependent dehydrogenase (short-subunit alcohol dehydrogenase family)
MASLIAENIDYTTTTRCDSMHPVLEDKTVIVTGVGAGLGHALAAGVLRDSGRVVLGARDGDKLAALAAELDPGGERVAHQATDVTDAEQCRSLVALATSRFGGVDGVVQVAAHEVMGGITRTSDDDWQQVLSTNVVGTMHVLAAAAEAMGERGGSFVIIGSQTFRTSSAAAQQTAYAASKGALHSAMFHAAWELGPKKIRVNMVVPSWMWGPAVQAFVRAQAERRGVDEDAVTAPIKAAMPLGEIPTVEDVADAAIFLCSDRARTITGQTLYVNAGNFMT